MASLTASRGLRLVVRPQAARCFEMGRDTDHTEHRDHLANNFGSSDRGDADCEAVLGWGLKVLTSLNAVSLSNCHAVSNKTIASLSDLHTLHIVGCTQSKSRTRRSSLCRVYTRSTWHIVVSRLSLIRPSRPYRVCTRWTYPTAFSLPSRTELLRICRA